MKTCIKCNIEKKLELFPKNRSKKEGIEPYCKQCRYKYYKKKKYHLVHYKRNPQKYKKLSGSRAKTAAKAVEVLIMNY